MSKQVHEASIDAARADEQGAACDVTQRPFRRSCEAWNFMERRQGGWLTARRADAGWGERFRHGRRGQALRASAETPGQITLLLRHEQRY